MSDLIKRQDAIDAFRKATADGDKVDFCVSVINDLPSAEARTQMSSADLISRQDAINAIENTDCELSADAWDELTNAIMQLPSAQRWIPCSERLPDINSDVLATLECGDLTYAWRFDDNYWCICEGDSTATTSEILAWMPLPEAYREEEI